ncbi:hypothetical protein ACHQM5_027936 [Ranunculus cassubicifolius]
MSDPFLFSSLLFIFFLSTAADDASIMKDLAKGLSSTPAGWTDADPCQWTGITCDNSGEVTSIQLSSKSISGTLPPNLNKLKNLQKISIQNNKFSGPLPSFSDLSELQTINLDGNEFTSVPPLCFSGLSSLESLSIKRNLKMAPWSFPEDLGESESLTDIDLRESKVTGVLPDIFGKLVSLQSLALSYNNLTGSLPPSLAGIGVKNLTLNNQDVGLSGGISVLRSMPELSQVWLHKNLFTGPIPDMSNCTKLDDLELRDNQLTGVIPPSLTSHPGLHRITLANNKLQGPFPEFQSQIQAPPPTTNNFCNPKPGPCDPQVTTLLEIVGAMNYPMSIAESWKGNDACQGWIFVTCDSAKKVTSINFSKQKFTGTISPAYANLTALTKLLLNDNQLTGGVPDSLTKLPSLVMLDISNNGLTGKIPDFPPKVKLLIGDQRDLVSKNTTTGEGGNDDSEGDSSKDSDGSKIFKYVAIVGGILVLIIVASMVSYRYITGRVTGKASSKDTESASQHLNAVRNEEADKEDYSDASFVRLFQGGNIEIPIKILRHVTNNFSPENIVGRGGFGVVYKGTLHDGTEIAVKRMESTVLTQKGLDEFEAEIAVLTKVRHRNLVPMLGFCTNDRERLLVFEYMAQGTLGQHLYQWKQSQTKPLTWKQRITIALDVARGVEYLHTLAQEKFIHRDLKSSNILLGNDMRAKVGDFGLVRTAPDGDMSVATRLAGTFGYLAPEYVERGKVSTKVDVYAFGAILLEIITGRVALDERRSDAECHLVSWFRKVVGSNVRKAVDPSLEPADEIFADISKVAELARHCTAPEANQRPDMNHAVNVLGPLVEQWTPLEEDEESLEDSMELTLPQLVEKWKAGNGSSTQGPLV